MCVCVCVIWNGLLLFKWECLSSSVGNQDVWNINFVICCTGMFPCFEGIYMLFVFEFVSVRKNVQLKQGWSTWAVLDITEHVSIQTAHLVLFI